MSEQMVLCSGDGHGVEHTKEEKSDDEEHWSVILKRAQVLEF